ncbi:MAG TPA: hypothetical protein VFC38_11840 [Stellaceae bacterium]|nr:hypothetical protein [Stellaceae bacterium]
MPTDIWNVLGALFIASAVLASHPLQPAAADRMGERMLANWNEIASEPYCAEGSSVMSGGLCQPRLIYTP